MLTRQVCPGLPYRILVQNQYEKSGSINQWSNIAIFHYLSTENKKPQHGKTDIFNLPVALHHCVSAALVSRISTIDRFTNQFWFSTICLLYTWLFLKLNDEYFWLTFDRLDICFGWYKQIFYLIKNMYGMMRVPA